MMLHNNILFFEKTLKPSKIFTQLNTYFPIHHNVFKKSYFSLVLNKISAKIIIINTHSIDDNDFYCLEWLKSYYPHIPVIVLFKNASCEQRVKMLKLGIHRYILKPFLNQELLIVVKKILDTSKKQHKFRTINIENLVFDIKNNIIVKKGEAAIHLTVLEADILKLLCLNAGYVVSRDDIMLQIKGVKHNPLDRSIDIHINNLRKKIETVPAQPKYIHTVRGKGYQLHKIN